RPNDPVSLVLAGHIAKGEKRFDDALEHFLALLKMRQDQRLLAELVDLVLIRGDHEGVLDRLEEWGKRSNYSSPLFLGQVELALGHRANVVVNPRHSAEFL
ncbi:MAG: hypothetical protein IH881_11055, partial [Myxococcales bacterium]|nr:hypothetical protein [Myxococcales bacterium]